MENISQTTILGKRKANRNEDSLVLHLSPSPSAATLLPEQSDPDSYISQSSSSKAKDKYIIVNGLLVPKTKKCYRCTYEGCDKAYTKPSRLQEHERTHTGQRPYVCQTCKKSYTRDTHLHAHARSHLPETERPFVCEKTDCGKRFWTNQHLRVHISCHNGAKPYKCNEAGCLKAFSKHHQLRAHICTEHSPPGTKPYICDHRGCTKSFGTNQHLRTHQKTHDDKRYTCLNVGCLPTSNDSPKYFATWSALQSHIKSSHPHTCTRPSCNGKIFASQVNLRAHMKLHEERDVELELDLENENDTGAGADRPRRKRRRGGELGRDWKCEIPGCDKDFKSKNALTTHTNVNHLGKRDFICQYPGCNFAFGYKHLLQRHTAKAHTESSGVDDTSECEDEAEIPEALFDIDALTGNAYAKRVETRLKEAKALRCPFPDIRDLADEEVINGQNLGELGPNSFPQCDYIFNRGYDLRRHFSAFHDIHMSKEMIDVWVIRQKGMVLLKSQQRPL